MHLFNVMVWLFPLTGTPESTVCTSLAKVRRAACGRAAGRICVGTSVVARSGDAGWQQGTVLRTVTTGEKHFKTQQDVAEYWQRPFKWRVRDISILLSVRLFNIRYI